MKVWLVQPRDPLIFRDGKSFSATPGARAHSLPFPYPSTLAGGVRTQAGRDGTGWFDPGQDLERLLQFAVQGPLLAQVNEGGEVSDWLLPAPSDCLIVKTGDKGGGKRLWIRPVTLPFGTTNLPEGLTPVSVTPVVKNKPHGKAPHFWSWGALVKWLIAPTNDSQPVDLPSLGIENLVRESRVHVSIDPETETACEGLLFQTVGLEFNVCPSDDPSDEEKALSVLQRYTLVVETDADLSPGVGFLGGERRIVHWMRSDRELPACPAAIRQHVLAHRHCRLMLTTPALFDAGYLPTWLQHVIPNLQIEVEAAAVRRYRAISGWDVEKGRAKPSRRVAPAGSVYFLSLHGDAEAVEQFIDSVWMKTVSDNEQDRRDGFGMALLGVWDGVIKPLEVK